MFDSNDIYRHLMNGGKPESLHKALDIEIAEADKKVQTTLELEKKEKENREKKEKMRIAALEALKSYFAFVNPDITEDIINSILDTLESVEIKVNIAKGKYDDEDWKKVWNFLFPFNFRSK